MHAVYADDALDSLQRAGAARIVTCNTIEHATNAIDLTDTLAEGVQRLLKTHGSGNAIQENPT